MFVELKLIIYLSILEEDLFFIMAIEAWKLSKSHACILVSLSFNFLFEKPANKLIILSLFFFNKKDNKCNKKGCLIFTSA